MSTLYELQQSWMEETRAKIRKARGPWRFRYYGLAKTKPFIRASGRAYRVSYRLIQIDYAAGVDPVLKITSRRN